MIKPILNVNFLMEILTIFFELVHIFRFFESL